MGRRAEPFSVNLFADISFPPLPVLTRIFILSGIFALLTRYLFGLNVLHGLAAAGRVALGTVDASFRLKVRIGVMRTGQSASSGFNGQAVIV